MTMEDRGKFQLAQSALKSVLQTVTIVSQRKYSCIIYIGVITAIRKIKMPIQMIDSPRLATHGVPNGN